MNVKKALLSLLAPAAAIIFALLVASIALWAVGRNPLDAFSSMWSFGTTSTSIASMINRAIPLYISAVAVAVGFQMGLFNIGVEGQYLLAALFAGCGVVFGFAAARFFAAQGLEIKIRDRLNRLGGLDKTSKEKRPGSSHGRP